MSIEMLVAVGAIGAVWLAGLPAARLCGLHGPLYAAAGWLFGATSITAIELALSVGGLRFSRPAFLLGWCIAAAWPLLLPAWWGAPSRVPIRTRLRGAAHGATPLTCLAAGICAVQVLYTLLQALRVPLGSFDAWSLWEYRGRRFWMDGAVTSSFLHDHAAIFAHPAYPPLISLQISWVYTWCGSADPVLMKPLFPAFFATLLLAYFAALRPRVGREWAAVATAALALVPRIAEYAGTGLADVPLTAALTATAAMLMQWRRDGRAASLLCAGALFGVAFLIKRDALFFVPAACCGVLLPARSWRTAARFLAGAAPICLPWYAYVAATRVQDRDFLPLSLAAVWQHVGRVGHIARLFALNLLALDEWSVLWFVVAALLLRAVVRRRVAAPLLLPAFALPLVLYVLSLTLSAWPDYTLHVQTSLDRLIMVTVPFALWFVVEQLVPVLTSRRPGQVPVRAPGSGTDR